MAPSVIPATFAASLRDALLAFASEGRSDAFLAGLGSRELAALATDWEMWARPEQMPPAAATGGGPWTVWLFLGGRGAGKTRAGAEWVRGLALGRPPFAERPVGRIALVGETAADVREVMVEGVSGLLAVHAPGERPEWAPSRRRLTWPNGAVAQAFSAEDPEALRGPQFAAAWADELAKWNHAEEISALDLLDAPRSPPVVRIPCNISALRPCDVLRPRSSRTSLFWACMVQEIRTHGPRR